jgi:hypothetical protein
MIVLPLNSSHAARVRMGQLAADDQAFRNSSGTLVGEPDRARSFGRLPRYLWSDVESATFTIYSYATPIAWRDAAGQWHMPADLTYSVTTSKHQSIVRSHI